MTGVGWRSVLNSSGLNLTLPQHLNRSSSVEALLGKRAARAIVMGRATQAATVDREHAWSFGQNHATDSCQDRVIVSGQPKHHGCSAFHVTEWVNAIVQTKSKLAGTMIRVIYLPVGVRVLVSIFIGRPSPNRIPGTKGTSIQLTLLSLLY